MTSPVKFVFPLCHLLLWISSITIVFYCIRGPKVPHFLLLSADHYLSSNREPGDLYCESYEQVAVLFATIPDFMQTFIDDSVGVGEECLKKLNLIISRFDKVNFNLKSNLILRRFIFVILM